jgi:hypothetical protein
MEKVMIDLAVPVTVNGFTFEPGVSLVSKERAEQFVRDGVAKYFKPPRERQKVVKKPAGPWRETVREGDIYSWQISLKLPAFAKPYIRAKYSESDERIGAGRGDYLEEVGGHTRKPTPTQAAAIDDLAAQQAKRLPMVMAALADDAKSYRAQWVEQDKKLADRILPDGMTPEQAAERVAFGHVTISERSRDGHAYVEYHGNCTWDADHGFTVVMHRDRVVGVYQQGTGWTDRRR